MESRMKTLCSALLDCMVLPLQDKLEDWRKSVTILDKEHAKEYKKLRSDVKKKWEAANRIQKKNNKQKTNNEQLQKAADASFTEVSKQLRALQETEKNAVRKALIEERSRYCTFVSCMKPVLSEEGALVSEFQQLEEITKKLTRYTEDPFKLPTASEAVINDMTNGEFKFQTPPSSPSSLGSRKSSMCSISSAGSSNGSPSHHAVNPRIRNQPVPPAMRLSSVSSQDSGFTSQDTLFLRPGSPSRRNQGPLPQPEQNVLTDRPHTISSAYEKGHQRPQLQPYTFNPPESTLTIHEEGDPMRKSQDLPPPPPPKPQVFLRPGSAASSSSDYRPPSIPGKSSLAATMAAAKQQQMLQQYQQQHQQQGSRSNLPDFNLNKNDMSKYNRQLGHSNICSTYV